jgi:hypothetical protein
MDVPHCIFWVVWRKRTPLRIRHAIVGEAMRQNPDIIAKSALRRVNKLREVNVSPQP